MTDNTPAQSPDPVFQYMTGQMHPTQPPLLAAYEQESAEAVAALRPAIDVRYGPHPRQSFDFFQAAEPIGTIAYFHAGYWQSRDKSQFRFIAPSFVKAGWNFALVNYPLCPDVTLAALTEAVRDCLPAILTMIPSTATDLSSLIAMGHSAGAQLAVELAMTDWGARGFNRRLIRGIVGLSGIYDLEPLLATPLNDKLRLDAQAARAASPVFRIRRDLPPALFAVGSLETDAFRTQTKSMCAAWQRAGNDGKTLIVEGCDHFSLLRSLHGPDGLLFQALQEMF